MICVRPGSCLSTRTPAAAGAPAPKRVPTSNSGTVRRDTAPRLIQRVAAIFAHCRKPRSHVRRRPVPPLLSNRPRFIDLPLAFSSSFVSLFQNLINKLNIVIIMIILFFSERCACVWRVGAKWDCACLCAWQESPLSMNAATFSLRLHDKSYQNGAELLLNPHHFPHLRSGDLVQLVLVAGNAKDDSAGSTSSGLPVPAAGAGGTASSGTPQTGVVRPSQLTRVVAGGGPSPPVSRRVSLSSPETELGQASLSSDLVLQVEFLAPTSGKNVAQVSVLNTVAELFGLSSYSPVLVRKVHEESFRLDFMELTFVDQYISSSEMWRLKLVLSNSAVHLRKLISRGDVFAQVNELLRSGQRVRSGFITHDTKLAFRSLSCRIFWLVQLSREMWYFSRDGRLYFELLLDFLQSVIANWRERGVKHKLTIVFFARMFYEDGASQPPASQDFYEVVFDVPRVSDYLKSRPDFVRRLKERFYSFAERIGWDVCQDIYKTHPTSVREDSSESSGGEDANRGLGQSLRPRRKKMAKASNRFVELKKELQAQLSDSQTARFSSARGERMGINSSAQRGNLLEAINTALSAMGNVNADRSFKLTGKSIVVFTAGNGIMTVDRSIAKLTKLRMIESGISCDIISMAFPPPYICPLFIYTDSKMPSGTGASVASDTGSDKWVEPNTVFRHGFFPESELRKSFQKGGGGGGIHSPAATTTSVSTSSVIDSLRAGDTGGFVSGSATLGNQSASSASGPGSNCAARETRPLKKYGVPGLWLHVRFIDAKLEEKLEMIEPSSMFFDLHHSKMFFPNREKTFHTMSASTAHDAKGAAGLASDTQPSVRTQSPIDHSWSRGAEAMMAYDSKLFQKQGTTRMSLHAANAAAPLRQGVFSPQPASAIQPSAAGADGPASRLTLERLENMQQHHQQNADDSVQTLLGRDQAVTPTGNKSPLPVGQGKGSTVRQQNLHHSHASMSLLAHVLRRNRATVNEEETRAHSQSTRTPSKVSFSPQASELNLDKLPENQQHQQLLHQDQQMQQSQQQRQQIHQRGLQARPSALDMAKMSRVRSSRSFRNLSNAVTPGALGHQSPQVLHHSAFNPLRIDESEAFVTSRRSTNRRRWAHALPVWDQNLVMVGTKWVHEGSTIGWEQMDKRRVAAGASSIEAHQGVDGGSAVFASPGSREMNKLRSSNDSMSTYELMHFGLRAWMWKSLVQPAVLPLTTDYAPDLALLQQDTFVQYVHTLFLPRTSDGVYGDSTRALLKELVCQRMVMDYQVVVGASDELFVKNLDSRELYEKSLRRADQYRFNSLRTSNARMNSSMLGTTRCLLTKGREYHELLLRPENLSVEVRRYVQRTKRIQASTNVEYDFSLWNAALGCFSSRRINLMCRQENEIKWNNLDQLLVSGYATYGDLDASDLEAFGCRNVSFMLTPPVKPYRRGARSNLVEWQGALDAFQNFVGWLKAKYRGDKSRSFSVRSVQYDASDTRDPNPRGVWVDYTQRVASSSEGPDITPRRLTKLDMGAQKSGGGYDSDWLVVTYDPYYRPDMCFRLDIAWVTCGGNLVSDFADLCVRKARTFGLSMVQIPRIFLSCELSPLHTEIELSLSVLQGLVIPLLLLDDALGFCVLECSGPSAPLYEKRESKMEEATSMFIHKSACICARLSEIRPNLARADQGVRNLVDKCAYQLVISQSPLVGSESHLASEVLCELLLRVEHSLDARYCAALFLDEIIDGALASL
ncbi:DEP domain-containing protein [Porphyridium purpureum]|uniref:DEP domain-containing protein n=1 Tax=Porphyridium purpureum TaxID=35688 RepID=A0A5J4Z1X3_PORPP|nr:DEP domain-containing protein [Porphyridium purpureum]|eukprot:POR9789..scf295_1